MWLVLRARAVLHTTRGVEAAACARALSHCLWLVRKRFAPNFAPPALGCCMLLRQYGLWAQGRAIIALRLHWAVARQHCR